MTATSVRMRRNLMFMGGGVLVSTLLQAALIFVIARSLGAHDYGIYSLALTLVILCAPLFDHGLGVWLVRAVSREPASLPATLGACLAWRTLLLLPVAALIGAIYVVGGYPAEVLALLLPLLITSFVDGLSTLASSVFQARERMGVSALVTVSRSVLRVLAVLLVLLWGGGVLAIAWAFAISALACAGPAWFLLRRTTAIRLDAGTMLPALRDAWPFGLALLAAALHAQVDVPLLGLFVSKEEIGQFHAGMRFFFLAALLPQTVAMVAAPLVHRTGLQGIAAAARVYRLEATGLVAAGLFLSLALALYGPDLVLLVLGEVYAGSAVIVAAAAPIVLVRFLTSPLAELLAGLGRQASHTFAFWIAVLVNVMANLLLIPGHGALGAVWATLISEVLLLALVVGAASAAGADLGWRRVLLAPLVSAGVALATVGAVAIRIVPDLPALPLILAALSYLILAILRPTAEQATLCRALWHRAPLLSSGAGGAGLAGSGGEVS